MLRPASYHPGDPTPVPSIPVHQALPVPAYVHHPSQMSQLQSHPMPVAYSHVLPPMHQGSQQVHMPLPPHSLQVNTHFSDDYTSSSAPPTPTLSATSGDTPTGVLSSKPRKPKKQVNYTGKWVRIVRGRYEGCDGWVTHGKSGYYGVKVVDGPECMKREKDIELIETPSRTRAIPVRVDQPKTPQLAAGATQGQAPSQAQGTAPRKRPRSSSNSKVDWVAGQTVRISQGKNLGEVGTVISSGHGFIAVNVRGEQIQKRANELQLEDDFRKSVKTAVDKEICTAAGVLVMLLNDSKHVDGAVAMDADVDMEAEAEGDTDTIGDSDEETMSVASGSHIEELDLKTDRAASPVSTAPSPLPTSSGKRTAQSEYSTPISAPVQPTPAIALTPLEASAVLPPAKTFTSLGEAAKPGSAEAQFSHSLARHATPATVHRMVPGSFPASYTWQADAFFHGYHPAFNRAATSK